MKTGDVVKLKSDSPNMTIIGKGSQYTQDSEDYCTDKFCCVWINDNKDERHGYYPEEALEIVTK